MSRRLHRSSRRALAWTGPIGALIVVVAAALSFHDASPAAPGEAAGLERTEPIRTVAVPRDCPEPCPTLYVVGTAHLDTQWLWTIQDSIREYVPHTLHDNFALFEKYPHYVFSFEGAFRYVLAKEYDPKSYAKLKEYVDRGRWRVAGSSVDAGDVNIPHPESLIRHVLYGNGFFRREFGKTSADIYLPDCFGFGWALPTVAAHCGLRSFSTQKLTWGSSVGVPFDVGTWEGVDGSSLVAELAPGDYVSKIKEDLSAAEPWRGKIDKLGRASGAWVGYRYFGTGDQGGAPDEESVQWLEKSLAGKGPVRVLSTGSDQLARDLPPAKIARLPRYRGELLMTKHGTGCYTSQAVMKRWNRRNEQLAAAAESASVAADWLGGAPYPKEKLRDAWVRLLWHHHHDDITGTSTPLAYPFSYNDEVLSMKAFGDVLGDAAGAVARALDTRGRGAALVVYNPLSFDREDVVEADVHFDGEPVGSVRVFGPDGRQVPAQASKSGPDEGSVHVLFLAKVPSMGFAVYDVRRAVEAAGSRGERGSPADTGLRVSRGNIENARYRVRVGEQGDVAAIFDKVAERELLAAPVSLDLFTVAPGPWPEWEIGWRDLTGAPRARIAGPATMRIVEDGPVRVAIEVTRAFGGSLATQRIRLSVGGAGDRVEVDTRLDWNTPATMLKATFPLAVGNPRATYDLGIGTIQRGNDTEKLYEVPAQKWADVTMPDRRYGVAILNDSKYGWDKPADEVLRLSLVHSPPKIEKEYGRHRFLYALAGHRGDWREGAVPELGARINQPLVAFQAPSHEGPLGRRFSLLRLSTPQVAVSALKMAEEGREVIVRLVEQHGRPVKGARLTMGGRIVSAREVTGAERPLSESLALGPLSISGARAAAASSHVAGGALVFSMDAYRPRTFALRLGPPLTRVAAPASAPVALDFDTDVASLHEEASDGDFDGSGHALPGEQLPRTLISEGIRFEMGPAASGAKNAVTCRGQSIPLFHPDGAGTRATTSPPTARDRTDRTSSRGHPRSPLLRGARRIYVLAAARGSDARAAFRIGDRPVTVDVPSFTGFVGQWQTLVTDGRIVDAAHMNEPYIKDAPVAWIGTHRHTASGASDPYVFCYLFKLRFDLAPDEDLGRLELTLPDDDAIRVLAVTLASRTNDDARPASEIVERVSGTRITPRGGLSIGPAQVSIASDRPGAELRYTVNGAEPTLDDPLYRGAFTIDHDATVRARAFFGSRGEDDVAVRRFAFGSPRPPITGGHNAPGLSYEVFEESWRDLSEIDHARSVRAGTSTTIDASPRTREQDFALRFTGFVEVPGSGVYTFTTRSDDGSILRIGDVTVVDNDGLHGSRQQSGQIALAPGRHPIEVLFFQKGGDIELAVTWEGPGVTPGPIPASALSH